MSIATRPSTTEESATQAESDLALRGVTIQRLDNEGAERWDAFVTSSARASIYHLSAWKDIVEDLFGHDTYYLSAISNGEVAGVLPLVRLRSRIFGDYLLSSPFVNYGGAIAISEAIESALMAEACKLADEIGSTHIEFRDTIPRNRWPVRVDKVAMVLDLPSTSDELWQKIGSKVRAQIKRPQREGAIAVHGGLELLDQWHQVFSRNMRDLGTPVYPKQFFATILEAFPESASITVVSLNNKPVAAGFLLGYKGMVEIPWASSLREVNRFGVNMLLYWEVLKRSVEQGYEKFDFGRSSVDSGTFRFKKQWGAEPQQLYWHYWLSEGQEMPNLTPNNPKYQMAIKAWQRLPVMIANWLGPMIVKNLP